MSHKTPGGLQSNEGMLCYVQNTDPVQAAQPSQPNTLIVPCMNPLFTRYVPSIYPLCTLYVPSLYPVCTLHVPRKIGERAAPTREKPIRCFDARTPNRTRSVPLSTVSANINQYPPVFANIHPCPPISTHIYKYPLISPDIHLYPPIPIHNHQYPPIFTNIHQYPPVSINIHPPITIIIPLT